MSDTFAAIMMLDVKGYSHLETWSVDQFFKEILPNIDKFLGKTQYKNSWGDGVIAVFTGGDCLVESAITALNITNFFISDDLGRVLHIPNYASNPLRVRVSLHFGQVSFGQDPIRSGMGCTGQAITLAARIEPIVEPNKIWCSENYATQLKADTNGTHRRIGLYERGKFQLAKDAGPQALFELVDKGGQPQLDGKVDLGRHPDYRSGEPAKPKDDSNRKVPDLTVRALQSIVHDAVQESIGEFEHRLYLHLPTTETGIFGERSRHFVYEKQAIAQFWMAEFRKSLQDWETRQKDKHLRLFLDSGTTVYPVFTQIMRKDNWAFLRNFQTLVITNNVPGFALSFNDQILCDTPGQETEGIESHIKMLPGSPLPRYRAIVSDETIEYLKEKYNRATSYYNVVVTTGNYATHDVSAIYARNKHHRDFKASLIDLADEVWVLLPLGKIVPGSWARADLNRFVERPGNSQDEYDTVIIPEDKKQRIIITSRQESDVLSQHFRSVKRKVAARTKELNANGKTIDTELLIVPFEKADTTYCIHDISLVTGILQEELEFPHNWMRREDIRDEIMDVFLAPANRR